MATVCTALKDVIEFLLIKRYIGNRHFPEDKLITSRIKWLSKPEQKEFENEYKKIACYLIKLKKRTGKSSEWHISINPKNIAEIEKFIGID